MFHAEKKSKITQRVKLTIINQTYGQLHVHVLLYLVICLMNGKRHQLYSVEEPSPFYSHENVKECPINNAKMNVISLNLTAKVFVSYQYQCNSFGRGFP